METYNEILVFQCDGIELSSAKSLVLLQLNYVLCISFTFSTFNTLRPTQNGRHFADGIFKCFFLNENVWISIDILLKFVPKGPINNIPALVQIMAWRRPGDKPLLYPRSTEGGKGVYWIHPDVCPSVRPSVRPSVGKVSATFRENYWLNSFHPWDLYLWG